MDAGDIKRYLTLVGEELKAMNVQEPIQLLLIGGGYMLTQIGNRAVTGDVDTVWVYPEVYANSEIYRLFRGAVQFVAGDEGLEPTWLNIDTGDFMRAAGPLPKMKLWKKFGLVHVYLPRRISFWRINLLLRERKTWLIFMYFVRSFVLILIRKHKRSWISISVKRFKKIIVLL